MTTTVDSIASYERIIVETCSECHRTSSTMFRLRNGFTITGIVCESCFNKYYKKDRTAFTNFSRSTDRVASIGLKGVKQHSAWMRTSTYSNYKEPSKSVKKEVLNYSLAKLSMIIVYNDYLLNKPDKITTEGQYKIIQYRNKEDYRLRCYYMIIQGKPVPIFLMDHNGKITIDFR